MNNQDILEPSISRSFPSFEQERHNLLCSELKQLYVAITRTKQRLWICENTDEYCRPMFDYWKKLCLVQVRHLDASLAQAMKAASSAEDWRVRGIKLFNEGNFELATMCFDKAGDRFSEKWAKAAGLVANADRVISTNLGMAEIALRNAAEIYESIGKPESAATCYIKLNDFKKAGMTYMEKCGISRLKDAGDCFAMAECWTHAANAYAKGKCFSECLSVCSKGGMFDTGLQIIEQWREASCFDEQQDRLKQMISSFVENCAVYYLELGDIQRMLKFLKSFSSNDILLPLLNLVRNFLKSRNLLVEMLTVEQELGNYLEAASIARMKGDMLIEAKMFEKAKYFEESARLFLFYVLIRSLWPPKSNGSPLKRFAEKENLLLKARELAKSKSGSFEEYVFLEAEILSDKERSLSDMSRHLFEAQKHQNVRQKVFTTRAILDVHIQSKPLKFLFQQSSNSNTEKLAYDMMSKNHIAVETMMYVWNLWKTMVLNLLSYLKNPEVIEDDHSGYEEFYLEYFGVRKEGKEDNCVLQIPEASWVKNTDKVFLRREKNVVWMAGDECISRAIFYWSRELFSVGMKVLESLEDLHRNFFEKYPTSKGRMAIWMFEVAKFLTESEFTSARSTNRTLGYLESSQTCYLDTVFPLDCRDDTMENLLLLHENNIAMEMVNISLDVNLSSRNVNLTHGQTGRLVMLLLVTGRLPDELFKRILSYLDNGLHWKEFIEQYKNFLDEEDQGTGPGAKAPDSIPLSISEEKDQGTGPGAKAPDSIPLSISEEKVQGTGPGAKDIDKGVIEQHNHFWLKLEEFLSGKADDVEDAINMLGSALENVDSKDFDERFITEVRNVHKELKLLAGLRSEGAPEGHPTRAILHAKCKGLRANFELLMGKLFSLIQGTSGEAEVLPESSSSIQTKASKGKQNKKSQKKNKGKSRRR